MDSREIKAEYLDDLYVNIAELTRENEKLYRTYLARNKQSGEVAVKKYVPCEMKEIYEKLKNLNCRNIEKVIDLAASDKKCIVITEYISGKTLDSILREQGLVSEIDAVNIICQLCDALIELRKLNIVHRDINPNNVMMSIDGIVKLIDFGISREFSSEKQQDTTILGTAGFAAPEQFGFSQTDARTDIYSVGVMMNIILTGQFPNQRLYEGQPFRKLILSCTAIDAEKRLQEPWMIKRELLNDKWVGRINSDKKGNSSKISNKNDSNFTKEPTVKNILIYGYDTSEWFILRYIPGFRTGSLWKMSIALLGYFIMIFSSFVFVTDYNNTVLSTMLEICACILYLWLAPLVCANVGHWTDKFVLTRKMPKWMKIVIRIFSSFMLFYVGFSLEKYVENSILS